MQAFKLIQWLDQLIGSFEAQAFMLRGNDQLDGETPVGMIKAGKADLVRDAVKCIAVEKGLFEDPWLPPHARKNEDQSKRRSGQSAR